MCRLNLVAMFKLSVPIMLRNFARALSFIYTNPRVLYINVLAPKHLNKTVLSSASINTYWTWHVPSTFNLMSPFDFGLNVFSVHVILSIACHFHLSVLFHLTKNYMAIHLLLPISAPLVAYAIFPLSNRVARTFSLVPTLVSLSLIHI